MRKLMLNYRLNGRRRIGRPLKWLLDDAETGISMSDSWRMTKMMICSPVSKYFFQTRKNMNISLVEHYVISEISMVVNGMQTLQGKLCARAHMLSYTLQIYAYVCCSKRGSSDNSSDCRSGKARLECRLGHNLSRLVYCWLSSFPPV